MFSDYTVYGIIIFLYFPRAVCQGPHRLWQRARFDQYIQNSSYKFPQNAWMSAHNLFISACQLGLESHARLTRKGQRVILERKSWTQKEKTSLLSKFRVNPLPFCFTSINFIPQNSSSLQRNLIVWTFKVLVKCVVHVIRGSENTGNSLLWWHLWASGTIMSVFNGICSLPLACNYLPSVVAGLKAWLQQPILGDLLLAPWW
jgi:hypothetical protein